MVAFDGGSSGYPLDGVTFFAAVVAIATHYHPLRVLCLLACTGRPFEFSRVPNSGFVAMFFIWWCQWKLRAVYMQYKALGVVQLWSVEALWSLPEGLELCVQVGARR